MTYSLSEDAQHFLDRSLIATSAIRVGAVPMPADPGIYGWWFDREIIPHISDGILTREEWRLLYVGIAPSRGSTPSVKARTLRDRLRNHLFGPIATSTLRRTLVALIRPQEGFEVHLTGAGKIAMVVEQEARLTEWISAHAQVMWSSHRTPWLLEEELLRQGPRLPLNISGSKDPFRNELKRLRAEILGIARREGHDYGDPRRFQAEPGDIKMLGKARIVDHLSGEERAQNAEHDRIVDEATKGLNDD